MMLRKSRSRISGAQRSRVGVMVVTLALGGAGAAHAVPTSLNGSICEARFSDASSLNRNEADRR